MSFDQVLLQVGNGLLVIATNLIGHGTVKQRFSPMRRQFQHACHIADGAISVPQLAPIKYTPAKVRLGIIGVQFDGARKVIHRPFVLDPVRVRISPVAVRRAPQVIKPCKQPARP